MKEKFKLILVWFIKFFDEDSTLSITRALNWIWTITLCSAILFVIIYNTLKTGQASLPPIDSGYVMLTSAFLAAKVGQRVFGENNNNQPQCPPATHNEHPVEPPPNNVHEKSIVTETIIIDK